MLYKATPIHNIDDESCINKLEVCSRPLGICTSLRGEYIHTHHHGQSNPAQFKNPCFSKKTLKASLPKLIRK